MSTQRPRDVHPNRSVSRTVNSAGVRRKWRIGLGVLSLAAGFALVSLASGNLLVISSAPKSAVTSAVTSAVKSAAANRAVRSTSNVADRSSDPNDSSAMSAGSCTELSSIELSFSPMPIAEGNSIWFNSAMSVNGLGSDPATIFLSNSRITFAANGTNYRLPVPDARITFDPGVTEATTSFDAASNRWMTIVPSSFSGRAFVSGLAFPVPAGGLPEDVGAVTWTSEFSTDTPGVTAQWQWAAAVYTTIGSDYNVLGVRAVDGMSGVQNAAPGARAQSRGVAGEGNGSVGAPANLGAFVTGGARGEGGPDFTGSFGTALTVIPCGSTQSEQRWK